MQSKGIFLVLEGTSGANTAAQFKNLKTKLQKNGQNVVVFDFPRLGEVPGYFVEEYLRGNYGDPDSVGPYNSSLFYALDRYDAGSSIRQALEQGSVVIAKNYTGSVMVQQGLRFANSAERKGFYVWLENLEYKVLGIPRPAATLVLRRPDDTDTEAYNDLLSLFPKDFVALDCIQDGKAQSSKVLGDQIWQSIQGVLPAPANEMSAKHQPKPGQFLVPPSFDAETKKEYLNKLKQIHAIYTKVSAQLQKDLSLSEEDIVKATDSLLTVAAFGKEINVLDITDITESPNLQKIANNHLSANYADQEDEIVLTGVWPRNEIELVADIIYPFSDLSLNKIKDEVADWSYDQKMKAFEEYMADYQNQSKHPLNSVNYSWDLLSSYQDFTNFTEGADYISVSFQPLTPRHGYDVPKIIEAAGLTDLYLEAFDLSLELYSYLQKQGHQHLAQLATLAGHKMRWSISFNAAQAVNILNNTSWLAKAIKEKIMQNHPMIAESLLVKKELAQKSR